MPDHLTDEQYWDNVWNNGNRGPGSSGIRTSLRYWSTWKFRHLYSSLFSQTGLDEADIFEIGCAPGSMLLLVNRMKPNYRLHGIDFADDGVEIAKQRLNELGVNAKIFHGDIREYPADRKYDIVSSHGLIEHFEDVVETVRHHKRFSRADGYVLITIPNYSHPVVKQFIKRFDPHALKIHNLEIM